MIKLLVTDEKVFVEVIPGVMSFLADLSIWQEMSMYDQAKLVKATYERLGKEWPPVTVH